MNVNIKTSQWSLSIFPFIFALAILLVIPMKSAKAIQRHVLYSVSPSEEVEKPEKTTPGRYGEPTAREEMSREAEGHHRMGNAKSPPPYQEFSAETRAVHEAETRSHERVTREEAVPRVSEKLAPKSRHKKVTEVQEYPRVTHEEKEPVSEGPLEKKAVEEVKKEEEHKVTVSPIPGVTFVETFIKVLDHELNGRFLGWRPNDLIIGRFTDNVNNFQLGLLEAARFTALRLKENLSRLGEADAYDPDLQVAVNLLMNKATLFWFPSAESSYNDALKHLRKYLERLKTGKAHFYYRVDTLLALVSSYRDFLGNCTNNLVKDKEKDGSSVSWFKADDYFYYSQGAAYLIYKLLNVVQVCFHEQLVTIDAADVMEEAVHELHRAISMSPWIILDRPLDSLFANHRANLGAVLGEATHLLTVMTQF